LSQPQVLAYPGCQPRRVGVFGGAFDPPHMGHITLAKTAIAQLRLDELRIIPTGEAWHKVGVLTPAVHRLAMAELAFRDLGPAMIDPRETQRTGASYTVDTLRELHAEFPASEFFVILGEDQGQAFTSWHRWEEIPRLATICVAARAGFSGKAVHVDHSVAPAHEFLHLQMPSMPLSSTDIRQEVANHHSVAPLVLEPVARYIDQHHLYQAPR
jgi:nicotinate-nucleotide adenylyltransferase